MKYCRKMKLALAMGISATALNMSPALAQDEEEAEALIEEIVVTGSRVARTGESELERQYRGSSIAA